MIKKLCTLLMLTILSAPLLAQTVGSESDGVLFAPQERPVASVCPAGRR